MKEGWGDIRRGEGWGERMGVAGVVDMGGSGPRRPGAAMAVTEAGEVAGSVSGGCVEGAVVGEALLAADISGVSEVTTLLGEPITVEVVDGTVVLNGGQATVVEADLVADNGVGHVIDGLLIPPSRAADLGG